MAVAQADIDTLNAAQAAYWKALQAVLDGMAAGESLTFTPNKDIGEITAEAVGTAAGDGETKGDFSLAFPVDNPKQNVTAVLVGTDVHEVLDPAAGDAFTSGDQVMVFTERGLGHDVSQLQFDSAKTGAITVTYTPSTRVKTFEQARTIVVEDETGAATGKGFATSPGNNLQAFDNLLALVNVGQWSSVDAV